VHRFEVLVDDLNDALDALYDQVAVALLQVSSAKSTICKHEVGGEEDASGRRVEAEVVVLVARRVERAVVVVTEADRLAVRDEVVDALEAVVEPPDVDVESRHDVIEFPDGVGVGVSEHDRVEVIDVVADVADDVEVVAGVNQHRPLASDEEDVAGESLLAGCEVADQVSQYGGPALVDVGVQVAHYKREGDN